MILHLLRPVISSTQTRGILVVDGNLWSLMLEDIVRQLNSLADKVHGKTAIPAGIYDLEVTYSPHFKKETVQIMNVPFFTGVRLHSGRDIVVDGDALDSEGCPLMLGLNDGPHGPALTDALTHLLKTTPGHHRIQIIDGVQA